MTLDQITLSGTPTERGVAHGERFADEIAANVDRYLEKFDHYGVDETSALEMAAEFLPIVESSNSKYAAEMRGIADGSALPLEEIALLNARYEVTYGTYASTVGEEPSDGSSEIPERRPDGCTSFGVQGEVTTTKHPYIGQNWDWIPDIDVFVMEVQQANAPNHIALTEAGIVGGKIGINEHGIALTLNGLVTSADGEQPFRKPYHVRFREILHATRLSEAVDAVLSTPRACSANILLGSNAGEILNLEVLPETASYLSPDRNILVHANHLEQSTDAESQFERLLPDTICRAPRLERLLRRQSDTISPEILAEVLSDHFDHPSSICRHRDPTAPERERSRTRVSAIIDIVNRRVRFSDGPPCESRYHSYSLSAETPEQ